MKSSLRLLTTTTLYPDSTLVPAWGNWARVARWFGATGQGWEGEPLGQDPEVNPGSQQLRPPGIVSLLQQPDWEGWMVRKSILESLLKLGCWCPVYRLAAVD